MIKYTLMKTKRPGKDSRYFAKYGMVSSNVGGYGLSICVAPLLNSETSDHARNASRNVGCVNVSVVAVVIVIAIETKNGRDAS